MIRLRGWLIVVASWSVLATAWPLAQAPRGAAGPARPAAAPAAPRVTFVDVAKAAGVAFTHVNGASAEKFLPETMGSGAVLFDMDGDDDLDLFVVDGGAIADAATAARARHRLYRNQGEGTFRDVTAASGIRHRGYGMGACAGDVDNDGRVDLYVTAYGPNTLYHNDGGGVFSDVTRAAGVALDRWSTSCAFLDADRDGDLDLFVANYLDVPKAMSPFCGDPVRRIRVYCHPLNFTGLASVLYRNDGRGAFADVSRESGVDRHVGNGLGVAVGDYDDDGWPDVFVANDAVPNVLFHNERNGRFAEVGLAAGVAVARDGKPRAGMGTEFADVNGDGRLDLMVTNHEFETHSLFRNDGQGLFTDVTVETGLGPPTLPFVGFGVALFDFDNDGALDIGIANGHVIDNTGVFRPGSTHAQRKLLLRNLGRRFADVGAQAGPGFADRVVGRTLVAGDLDNDGDLDLVVTANGGALQLLRNDGGNRRNAVVVRAVGRSNRDALGARVSVVTAAGTVTREVKSGSSYEGQGDVRVHAGLGASRQIERIEIRWPGGAVERVERPPVNHRLTVEEGKGLTSSVAFAPPAGAAVRAPSR